MELTQIVGPAATLITAGLAVWRVFGDRRAGKKSGKRLAYSLHIPADSLGKVAQRMKYFPGLRDRLSRKQLPENAEGRSMEAYVFLWNSGTEPISSEDFLSKNSLRIHVHDAAVKSAKIAFLSHATVGADAYVPSTLSEWEGALHGRKAGIVELRFEYLPPNHGAVLKVRLARVMRRVPLITVVGPVKGLKQTTFAGTLFSVKLQDDKWLRRSSLWIETRVNLSLAAMGGTLIGMVLWGGFTHGLSSIRYLGGMLAVLMFEMAYLIFRDLREQIRYRIPNKLAWWDVIRSERD